MTDEFINKQVDFKIFSGQFTPIDKGDGKLRIRTVASSSIEDLSGDIVTPNALKEMAESAKGMTIFRNHSYNVPRDIFGSVEKAWVEIAKGRYDDNGKEVWQMPMDVVIFDKNPDNVQTWEAVEAGTMLGTSIGAMIPRGTAKKNSSGGITFESLKLKEASIVGIPQNPLSMVQYATKALRSAPDEEDEFTNEEFIKAGDEVEKGTAWMETAPDGSVKVTVQAEALPPKPEADPAAKKKDAEPEIEKAEEPEVEKALEPDLLKDFGIDFENLPDGDQEAADALYAEYDEIDKAADPDLVKAPLSSAARNNLPDSSFACPEKRKYPIQDKAHLRNALARCGDSSNDQCGCDKVRAAANKAGMGSKDVEPELVKEAAVVAANSEDETPAQALEQSIPESAEAAANSGEDSLLSDTVSRSASLLADVVKSQNAEIFTLRKSLHEMTTERDNATAELLDVRANYKVAKEIVETIAKTPLGRKGVVAAQVSEFETLEARYGGIYSANVLKSLEKK